MRGLRVATYPDDVHFNSYHLLHAGRHQDFLGIGRVQRRAERRPASVARTSSLRKKWK